MRYAKLDINLSLAIFMYDYFDLVDVLIDEREMCFVGYVLFDNKLFQIHEYDWVMQTEKIIYCCDFKRKFPGLGCNLERYIDTDNVFHFFDVNCEEYKISEIDAKLFRNIISNFSLLYSNSSLSNNGYATERVSIRAPNFGFISEESF